MVSVMAKRCITNDVVVGLKPSSGSITWSKTQDISFCGVKVK